jgi:hypothetical protein
MKQQDEYFFGINVVTHEDGVKFMHIELMEVHTDGYSPMKMAAADSDTVCSAAPVKKMNSTVNHIELPSYAGTCMGALSAAPLPLLDLNTRSLMKKRIPLTMMMRTLQSR